MLLLLSPDNIWLASCLPANTPNYSAWLRNAPFFVYGMLAILALARATRRAGSHGGSQGAGYLKNMTAVIAALLCSFTFYGIDIFFSHKIGGMGIWMAMIAKTIAYIVAAIAMWRAEFKSGPEPGGSLLSDI